jgi:ATP-dependent phosphofructokinase / diphosphate-dependent phosphofructokinase
MKNLLITMSGGTTSVINATLAGAVRAAQKSNFIDKIYAGYPGILGFMNDGLIDLTSLPANNLQVLKHSPGSASIGTTRTKIFDHEDLSALKKKFKQYNIGYFINIGGNGTIKQTKLIAEFIQDISVAAAPKTVDNDLGDENFEDLWFTPGFPSCVNFWMHKTHMLNNESLGAYTNDKVLIAQTFGRETGFLAGSLRLYDKQRRLPILLLLPEDQQNCEKIIDKIDDMLCKFNRAIVGICEGYAIKDFDYNYDLTGQKRYGSSSSSAMQQLINLCTKNSIQARGYNPTVDQRQNFNYTIKNDIEISYNLGIEIIKNFNIDNSHFFQSYSKQGYKIISLSEINNFSRVMKNEWIDYGNFDVTDEYTQYLNELADYTLCKQTFLNDKML